ncbi:MAG: type II toxin-antitoxin system Phd/YefM family antitoxin [Alphaproteobacteria bacterium]|nr:type II toxin-antitoxin system Phd/YefM family antitoxin [Alphaproteobacteria bacterium]
MQVIGYTKSREKLSQLLDDVVANNETVIITKNNESAVLISLEEYNNLKQMELHNWQLQKMARGLSQAKNREFATAEEVQAVFNKCK